MQAWFSENLAGVLGIVPLVVLPRLKPTKWINLRISFTSIMRKAVPINAKLAFLS